MEKQNFVFRCVAYQEKDSSFTGVCLDLDIVEEGHATLQEAILSINDAINSHIKAAGKLGFPKELIVRSAPKEYWDRLTAFTTPKLTKHSISAPFQAYNLQAAISPRLSYA